MTDEHAPQAVGEGGIPNSDEQSASVDPGRYVGVGQLRSMPREALAALVDSIPSERLHWYESVLANEIEDRYGHGEVDEAATIGLMEELLDAYESGKKVPIQVVQKWVIVPENLRRHVESGEDLEPGPGGDQRKRPSTGLLVATCGAGLVLIFSVFLLIQHAGAKPEMTAADLTASAASPVSAARPTELPLTPTPLALDAADRVIEDGEDLGATYPVLLEVTAATTGEKRVFVVQQRAIDMADWDYSGDPDTASWVSGLLIRPVLGIPYTPDNARLFEELATGDRIQLQMSTGAELTFTVDAKERVGRQDTAIFRQVSPGVTLVLLADPEGDRLTVSGSYPASQEASRREALETPVEGDLIDVGETIVDEVRGLSLSISGTRITAGEMDSTLPDDLIYLLIDVHIEAGEATVDTSTMELDLVDAAGTHYAPLAANPPVTERPALSGQRIDVGDERDASIVYIVPQHLVGSLEWRLRVKPDAVVHRLVIDYASPHTSDPRDLEILLRGIEAHGLPEEAGRIVTSVRIFNPTEHAISVGLDDVYLIAALAESDEQFPVGPRVQPLEWRPLTVEPGKAEDVAFEFAWDGSPTIGLQVAGREYLAVLEDES